MQLSDTHKIIILMGKSACGKDTIFKILANEKSLNLKQIIPYTTRPMREGEKNGREYFFVPDERFKEMQALGKVIEYRTYQTVHGLWTYFTAHDGQFDLGRNDYILISTLEAYNNFVRCFGREAVLPILITLEDGERIRRALGRERKQATPRYEEMCRRFLADCEDYSDENVLKAGIEISFENQDLDECVREIREYILEALK